MGSLNTIRNQVFLGHVVLLAVIGLLAACAGQTKIESDLGIKGAPDWVNEGSQAVSDKNGRLIQGVGFAEDLGDTALQKATADNRARAEIARVLSSYFDVAVNDYLASSGSGQDATSTTNVSSVQQQINSVSRVVLNGSRIMGNWKDKKTDTIYSFAELDLEKIKEIVGANQSMSDELKAYLVTQGDVAFDNFIKEN